MERKALLSDHMLSYVMECDQTLTGLNMVVNDRTRTYRLDPTLRIRMGISLGMAGIRNRFGIYWNQELVWYLITL